MLILNTLVCSALSSSFATRQCVLMLADSSDHGITLVLAALKSVFTYIPLVTSMSVLNKQKGGLTGERV